jgi:23S rRNA (pseudouridine1915-N3)-methyltransferase
MRLHVCAVGLRMPAWAQSACDDFVKRMPIECAVVLHEVKPEARSLGKPAADMMKLEAKRLEAVCPRGAWRVVLDERGERRTTLQLAKRLTHWQGLGVDVALFIGGPDGLDADFKAQAGETLRLSDLTLPHALARVMLVEALYRAHSLNQGHPYHRE